MRLVLAAAATKLLELQAARGRLLVLGRRVIPLLALGALQCHNFPHILYLFNPSKFPDASFGTSIPRI